MFLETVLKSTENKNISRSLLPRGEARHTPPPLPFLRRTFPFPTRFPLFSFINENSSRVERRNRRVLYYIIFLTKLGLISRKRLKLFSRFIWENPEIETRYYVPSLILIFSRETFTSARDSFPFFTQYY